MESYATNANYIFEVVSDKKTFNIASGGIQRNSLQPLEINPTSHIGARHGGRKYLQIFE